MSVEIMETIDNSELVRAARKGDRQAFGALVERYQGMVFGGCLRMTADSFEAEDLAHDAFIDAFLKIGQLEDAERFAGWLRTLTLNVCRMWLRAQKGVWSEGVDESEVAVEEVEDVLSGRLIRGLGKPAVEAVMDCYFEADEPQTRAHALTLLRELMATARKRPPEEEGTSKRLQELAARRAEKVQGDARPFLMRVTTAAVCMLPEIKSYSEPELTYHIAQVDYDFSHTRRHLVVKRIMRRVDREYELTEMGEGMWRVERFIAENYLRQ